MPELIWDGKYDAAGKRTAPLRVALPFQTVETVNETAQERQRTLDFFASERSPDWRNRLIWGDNKYVLPSILLKTGGPSQADLCRPSFRHRPRFFLPTKLKVTDFVKEPSVIEQKAYGTHGGGG